MTRSVGATAVSAQETSRSGFRRRTEAGISAWSQARIAAPSVDGNYKDKWLPMRHTSNVCFRNLQLGLGRVIFDSPLSALGAEFVSLLALTYGASFPGSYFYAEGGLAICSGLPKAAYPRGGICVGRVFLTGPEPSERVVAHERRHVEQWERYGLALIGLYFLEGANPMTNRFEIEAGLVDGGYASEGKTLRD